MVNQRVRFNAGERLSARKLNRLAEQAFPGRGASGSISTSTIQAEPIRLMEISQVDDIGRDMDCHAPGQPTTGAVTVELLPIFTETSRGSINYTYIDLNTREADDSNSIEQQQITPLLQVGDVIPVFFDGQTGKYFFIPDGRMWAKTG